MRNLSALSPFNFFSMITLVAINQRRAISLSTSTIPPTMAESIPTAASIFTHCSCLSSEAFVKITDLLMLNCTPFRYVSFLAVKRQQKSLLVQIQRF